MVHTQFNGIAQLVGFMYRYIANSK